MSATPNPHNGWCPEGAGTQLPPGGNLPLAANEQVGQGQYLTFNTAGDMICNDGTISGVVAAGVGYPGKLSDVAPTPAAAFAKVWTGYGGHNPASSAPNDGFTKADQCVPAWGANENALGKLSSVNGVRRPLLGLVFGTCEDTTGGNISPRAWVGPVAQAVARGVLLANSAVFGSVSVADAAATTAISESAIQTSPLAGAVTSVQFVGAAVTANATDFATVIISKRSLATAYATAVEVARYDTRPANNGAITLFTPALFTLSAVAGALTKLETDIYTITTVKGGAGRILNGTILVNGKVL